MSVRPGDNAKLPVPTVQLLSRSRCWVQSDITLTSPPTLYCFLPTGEVIERFSRQGQNVLSVIERLKQGRGFAFSSLDRSEKIALST
jgi:hypothetical protein